VYVHFWERADAELFSLLQLRSYDLARASVPLMEGALARCQVLASGDEVAANLVPYLDRHIEEERNHDVWLLDDLEHLGLPRQEVLARPPSLTAACLVGAQYYWIFHDHPIALLGYMAGLEGCIASSDSIEAFIKRTGIPREGLRTLLLHAKVDPQHEADLDDLIDRMPLNSRHTAAMGLSALHTVSLLATLTQELLDYQRGWVDAGSRRTQARVRRLGSNVGIKRHQRATVTGLS
jgi:heme oxygenase-like protein